MSYKKLARNLFLAALVIVMLSLAACSAPKETPTPAPVPTLDPFQEAPDSYVFLKITEGETETLSQVQFYKDGQVEATRSLGSQSICDLTVLDIDPDKTQLPKEQRIVIQKKVGLTWEGNFYIGSTPTLEVELYILDPVNGYQIYVCDR